MTILKRVHHVTWGLVALTLFFAMAIGVGWWKIDGPGRIPAGIASIGGPFAMTDHNGRRVTDKDFAGRPLVVFFGFTFCPDVCPTTLTNLTGLMADAGPAAERIQILFVSVDHERDTPPVLKDYMTAFNSRFLALTGSAADVAAMAKAYRAHYKKVQRESAADYTMDHTALVFLMDSQHRFIGTIDLHLDRHMVALAKLRRLASN